MSVNIKAATKKLQIKNASKKSPFFFLGMVLNNDQLDIKYNLFIILSYYIPLS